MKSENKNKQMTRILGIAIFSLIVVACEQKSPPIYTFTEQDVEFLKEFSLSSLGPIPAAPSNSKADDLEAARLGHKLFFDKRFSSNSEVSCASCHQPEKYFTDGLKRSQAVGTVKRNAPSVLTSARSSWLFWDGRKDSLWSQALGPFEDTAEHNLARTRVVQLLARYHRKDYERVFGELPSDSVIEAFPSQATPLGSEQQQALWQSLKSTEQETINRVFSNLGKSLMAYQRKLRLTPSPFDQFIDELANGETDLSQYLTPSQVSGLRLFVGKANCASCHNGPLFTNFEFHNIGAPESDTENVDLGRYLGVAQLSQDEFTCLSAYSDAKPSDCLEMRFLKRQGPELVGAFKTPSLRNVTKTAPYMQTGQFAELAQVIEHYNLPTPPYYDRQQHPNRPHFDILPLKLTEKEKEDLIAFLGSLTSPIPEDNVWWKQP